MKTLTKVRFFILFFLGGGGGYPGILYLVGKFGVVGKKYLTPPQCSNPRTVPGCQKCFGLNLYYFGSFVLTSTKIVFDYFYTVILTT